MAWAWWLVLGLAAATADDPAGPEIADPAIGSTTALEGTDISLECVVRNIGEHAVLWRRLQSGSGELLSVNKFRVVADTRFSVYNNEGHDTWVLNLERAQGSDSGRYVCEVNTIPPIQAFYLVTVIGVQAVNTTSMLVHNYTDCCMDRGVSPHCLGFCSLYSILTGGFYASPWQCADYLPTITRCMTDGRDHTPCCERQRVPEPCSSACRGDFELETVVQHAACAEHTVPTLACVAEGVQVLPGPPRALSVETLSPTELRITWNLPHQPVPVAHFQVNVTRLAAFDPPEEGRTRDGKALEPDRTELRTVRLSGNATSYTVRNLAPLTMYEVRARSENNHGRSVPSYAVRVLTPPQEESISPPTAGPQPTLPDIPGCCARRGVKPERCRRTLCDPTSVEHLQVTDVMICAPWANVTFECLTGGVDHSACCAQRGVPELCRAMCAGNVTRLDFRHFVCMEYMTDLAGCLLDHFGVLPGPPRDVTVVAQSESWAVVRWKPPAILAETVTHYVLQWRKLDDVIYNFVPDVASPFLLDHLEPDTRYEVFLEAMNTHGMSLPSPRELFSTNPRPAREASGPAAAEDGPGYNETACCLAAGLRDHCLPLCSYQVKMSALLLLGPLCTEELPVLARCGAGGRNHEPCCERRLVTPGCLPLCAGRRPEASQGLTCASDLGKVLQCMREGSTLLPEPPADLHATAIGPTSISLRWAAPNASVSEYRVLYVPVASGDGLGTLHPDLYNKSLTVNTTDATLTELRPDTRYSLYVIAVNPHGKSLPSLLLSVHTGSSNNATATGELSPPYAVEVPHQTVNSLVVSWNAPLHVPPDAFLNYVVFYAPANELRGGDLEELGQRLATASTGLTIGNLSLNTEYALAVRARSGRGHSALSEVVLAWTDPAIPAMVNPPVVIPAGAVPEGSNVTLLCIGMGNPVPVVSLYVNGKQVAQRKHRHVAWEMTKVSRNLTHVACFADNGFGPGAHSAADVAIYFQPTVSTAVPSVKGTQGAATRLQCVVAAHPKPNVTWLRGTSPVTSSPDLEVTLELHPENRATYLATLSFKRLSLADAGSYMCEAHNSMGSARLAVKLDVVQSSMNTSGCCHEQGVQPECMDACTFDIDIQLAIARPQCFPELHKLMLCAADGRDHQQCCRQRGVPRGCLRWCRGNPVANVPVCVLSAAKDIVACFEEGKAVLPGQPTQVRIEQTSPHSARLTWSPPARNSRLVQWYRVVWRPVGSRDYFRNQTSRRFMDLDGLESGRTYEVVVKAGNHYGTSLHTDPTLISLADPQPYPYHIAVHVSLGLLSALVVAGIVLGAFFYLKRRVAVPPTNGVSFENPTYLKDGISLQPTSTSQRAVANIYEEPKVCAASDSSVA